MYQINHPACQRCHARWRSAGRLERGGLVSGLVSRFPNTRNTVDKALQHGRNLVCNMLQLTSDEHITDTAIPPVSLAGIGYCSWCSKLFRRPANAQQRP